MDTPHLDDRAAPDAHDVAGHLMVIAARTARPGAVADALLAKVTGHADPLELALDTVEVLARTAAHLATDGST